MARLYLSPPHVGPEERELLLDAFDSNWIAPLGPHVNAFEDEFAGVVGVPAAAALSSGTAALHLALVQLGVGAGDDVLTCTLTFAATANAVTYVGARPCLLDCSLDTWTLDPDLLEEELEARSKRGRLPKAVITVDLYGQCADYARIVPLCQKYDVPIVQDAAEALGATGNDKAAGAHGQIGVFSFNGNKIITTSGGGMLVGDVETCARTRFLATQAREPAPHYEHETIGYNYRMSNLLAAVGRGQLAKLEERVERRREINAFYRRRLGELGGVSFMPEASYGRSTFWLSCLTIDSAWGAKASEIREHLEAHDIECRPVWKPMHLQPVFRDAPMVDRGIAADLFQRGLCLPSGSAMTEDDLSRVCDAWASVPRTK